MDFSISDFISEHSAAVSSVLGSLTSAYFTELKTWRERCAAALMGIPAAILLGPVLDDFLRLGENASGYLMGFFGLNVCAACLKAVRRFGDDADFWTLLRESVTRCLDKFGTKSTDITDDKEQ